MVLCPGSVWIQIAGLCLSSADSWIYAYVCGVLKHGPLSFWGQAFLLDSLLAMSFLAISMVSPDYPSLCEAEIYLPVLLLLRGPYNPLWWVLQLSTDSCLQGNQNHIYGSEIHVCLSWDFFAREGGKSSVQSFHQVSEEQLFGSKRKIEHFIVHLQCQSFYTSCPILASQKWVQVGNLSTFEWERVVRKVKWHSQFSADIKCSIPILNWGAQIPRFSFHTHCRAGFLKRPTS